MEDEMPHEYWQKLKRIFNEALELEDAEREVYLDKICGEDLNLKEEVLSLIAAYDTPGVLDNPPEGLIGSVLSPPTADEKKGARVGPYKILKTLGHGGMGSVYLAERADGQFDQQVALKLLRTGFTSENQTRRFLAERQILATLNHKNIARLLDGGVTEDGQPWFALEYVKGEPIDEYCNTHVLTMKERLTLFQKICEAVQYAHRKLIIHRDLKPSNILVTTDGTVKLLDFGIAKILNPEKLLSEDAPLTRTGSIPLTPAYASPEQVRGEPITTTSDIYQLGIVLYELLCGCRPYEISDKTPSEIERIICENRPIPPSTAVTYRSSAKDSGKKPQEIDGARRTEKDRLQKQLRGDLDTIVMKILRKEPDRRYDSVEQLSTDICNYLEGRPVTAHPDSMGYRIQKYVKRYRWGVAATVAIFISLVMGTSVALWQAGKANQAAELAQKEAEKANRALAESERSLARAESLHNFLINLFWAADPNRPADELPSTEDLLELGAQQALDEELAQPPERIGMLNVISEIYLRQGWTEEARPLLDEAIKLGNKQPNEWPQDLARALQLKADLSRQEGNIDHSRSLLIKAEEVLESLKDDYWNRYADIQADRSYLERLDQNYEQAIQILEPIYEEIQNREDTDLELKINILNFLSSFYAVVGRLREADRIRNENIEIIEKLEGSESLNYGINLMNSVSLKYNLGQFDIAEKRAREAISIYNHIYDEPTGVESVVYGKLAATKLYSGQFNEALSTLETANEKWARNLNKDPDKWQIPQIYRGLMLGQMNRWEEAKPKLLQTRDLFDQGHYTMYHNTPDGVLAEALCRSGSVEEGEFILNEMNVSNDQTNVENPVYQAQVYESRARCHFESGSLKKARQEITKSLDTMNYPGRVMERAERKHLLAKILIKSDRVNAASRQMKEAEQLLLHLDLADHPALNRIRREKNELISLQN